MNLFCLFLNHTSERSCLETWPALHWMVSANTLSLRQDRLHPNGKRIQEVYSSSNGHTRIRFCKRKANAEVKVDDLLSWPPAICAISISIYLFIYFKLLLNKTNARHSNPNPVYVGGGLVVRSSRRSGE